MSTLKYLVVLFAAFISNFLAATTIQKFTFEELVDFSALIIEGEVTSSSTFTADGLVYTRILITVQEVLKGDNPGEFVELDFLGGEEGGNAIQVSGQFIPLEGERGFYFIENLSNTSVNPLIGWSQGHFRIIEDAKGNEHLETDVQQELLELTENKNAVLAAKLKNMKFSNNLVSEADFTPVTPDELRDAVNALLD